MMSKADCRSPGEAAGRAVDSVIEPEYITTAEVAARLRWSTRTLREKVRTGVFRLNEHFSRLQNSRTFWKWSAIARSMESGRTSAVVEDERVRNGRNVP